MTRIFSLQLSDKEYKAIETIAKQEDRSKAYLVRSAILNFIQDQKDIKKAKKTLKEIKLKKRAVVKWDDIKDAL